MQGSSTAHGPGSPDPSRRILLAVAVAAGAAWIALLTLVHRELLVDEWAHLAIIRDYAAGRAPDLTHLPMIPVFHRVMALLHPLVGGTLPGLRAIQMVLGILAFLLLRAALAEDRERPAGAIALAVFLLPPLFPFLGLVYTEALTTMILAAAVWAQTRRRFVLAATCALAACAVRQSVLPWLPFLGIWAVGMPATGSPWSFEEWRAWRSRGFPIRALGRGAGVLAALALVLGVFFIRGSLLAADVPENRPGFNPAQLEIFLITLAALLLPVWAPALGGSLRRGRPGSRRPSPRSIGVGVVTLGGILALTFGLSNPHPWNQGEDPYLRNLLLQWLDGSVAARSGSSVLLGLAALGTAIALREVPGRGALGLVFLFGLASLLPLQLVEPRYFIFPLLFIHLFLRVDAGTSLRLAAWYGILSTILVVGIAFDRWMP